MPFVLDASVAVAWVVPSQTTEYARRVRRRARREAFHVPAIFPAEVANALLILERRRIMSAEAGMAAADVLERLDPVVHGAGSAVADLRRLAARFGLSAYDATYLSLALELKLPLACGDGALRAVLPRAGVKLA